MSQRRKRRRRKANAATEPSAEASTEPTAAPSSWLVQHRTAVVMIAAVGIALVVAAPLLLTSDPFLGQGADIVSGRHPRWALLYQRLWRGEFPLWFPYILGGLPLQTSPSGRLSPMQPSLMLLSPYVGIKAALLLGFALAIAGAAWWACRHTRGVWPPVLAGSAYGLSGFAVLHMYAGHDRMLHTAAVLPWLLGWLERACERGLRSSAMAIAALMSGWMMLIGHHHAAYIAFMGLGLYVPLARGFAQGGAWRWDLALRALGVFAVVALAGVAISTVLILPSLDTVALSHRSQPSLVFNASASAEPVQLLTYLWPDMLGNRVDAPLAGPWNYHETVGYVGVAPLLLALLAPGVLGWRRALPGLAVICVGVVLSLGTSTPLFEWFIATAPKASAFRSWGRMVLLVALGVAVLAAMTLDRWLYDEPEDRKGWLVPAWLLLAVVSVAWLGWAGRGPDGWQQTLALLISGEHLRDLSASGLAALAKTADADLLRTALLAAVAVGALHLGKRAGRRELAAAVIVLLTCGELTLRAQRFLTPGPAEEFEWPAGLMTFLEQHNEPGLRLVVDRTLHTSGRGATLGISEVAGYSPFGFAPYMRYLLRSQGHRDLDRPMAYLAVRSNNELVERLGARYLLSRWPLASRRLRGFDRWQPVGNFGRVFAYENPSPQPRAFVVHRAVVADEAATSGYMGDPSFELRSAVFVEAPLPQALQIQHDAQPDRSAVEAADEASITRLEPDEVELAVRSQTRGLVVLSDTWHTGWRAEVDGHEAPLLLVDRFMRAVPVGPGKHTVVMRYQPTSLYVGGGISLAALLAVLAFWLWARRRERRSGGGIGVAVAAGLVCMLGCAPTAEQECHDDVDRLGACGRAPADDVCSNSTDRCYTACNARVRCEEWPRVDQGEIPAWLNLCWWSCVPTFACVDDGHAIDARWVCDGDKDCVDGSDEDDCDYHQCGDGRLINAARRCDRFPNCDDRSDEQDCGYYLCLDNTMTVTTEQRCDGTDDCEDRSDEFNCGDAGD